MSMALTLPCVEIAVHVVQVYENIEVSDYDFTGAELRSNDVTIRGNKNSVMVFTGSFQNNV